MGQETYWRRVVWRLAIALILAVPLWLVSPLPAAAQSVQDYFQISYDPVSFSKTEIQGSEVFQATVQGRANCTQDLPIAVDEASIASRVVAEHAVSGTRVTLNSGYTITIKPFPSKEGDIAEIEQDVPLQFPAQAESGDYNVIGEIIEAKAKVGPVPIEVTESLPQFQLMGSLNYTATEPIPASAPEPAPTPEATPPESGIAWWVWLTVATAAATTVLNIVWYLRHRTG